MPNNNQIIKMTDLSVLIVDKSDFEINTTKKWIQQIGVSKINTANTLQKAIKMMKRDKYDIILCEYELKKDSGLELLKEMRNSQGYSSSFSIMTSSNDKETMVELLESVPDDIFIKPFSPDSFNKRMRGIIKRYQSTKDIRKALEVKDYEKALSLASDQKYDELSSSNQAFASWLEKTKIEIMLFQRRFSNVIDYTSLLLGNKKYDLEWIRAYQLKAHLELGSFQVVIEKGEKIIKKYPLSIKSYILMGDAFYGLNKLAQSTKNYNRALSLSKNSVSAQRSVSKVHHEIGDYEKSIESYKKLLSLVDRSIEKRPEDYYGYANVRKESAEIKVEENLSNAIAEALNVIKKGQQYFPDDIIFDVHNNILDAQELLTRGLKKEALVKMNGTMKEFEHIINRNGSALINSLLTFQQLGETKKADKMKEKVLEDKVDFVGTTLESRYESFKNQDIKTSSKAQSLLREYLTDMSNQNYEAAALKAKSALVLAPKSFEIVFKLLEAKLLFLQKTTPDPSIIKETVDLYTKYKSNKLTLMESVKMQDIGKKLKIISEANKKIQKENKLKEQLNQKALAEERKREKEKAQKLLFEEEKRKKLETQIEKEVENKRKQLKEDKQKEKEKKEAEIKLEKEREKRLKERKEKENKKTISSNTLMGKSKEHVETITSVFNNNLELSVTDSKNINIKSNALKEFELLTKEQKIKEINDVKVSREDLTSNQVSKILKLRKEKKYSELKKVTFQIKKKKYMELKGF